MVEWGGKAVPDLRPSQGGIWRALAGVHAPRVGGKRLHHSEMQPWDVDERKSLVGQDGVRYLGGDGRQPGGAKETEGVRIVAGSGEMVGRCAHRAYTPGRVTSAAGEFERSSSRMPTCPSTLWCLVLRIVEEAIG